MHVFPDFPGRFFALVLVWSVSLHVQPGRAQEADGQTENAVPMRGFRFPTRDAESSPATAPAPSTEGAAAPPLEGALKVGLVEGQAKLPPELAALAQSGAMAVTKQDWAAARDSYLKMVQLAPDNALALANLGVAEQQLGNLLAASGNLRKSLEINPANAANWQTLGLIYFEQGELNLAVAALCHAIHENPGDGRSRLYLAAIIRDYGWREASITELERAVQLDPKLRDAHFNLAASYLESSPPRIELARRHYFAALDLGSPPDPQIEKLLASPQSKSSAAPKESAP
jgi:tetratricopeptide (TPR) repeat protein